MRIVLSEHVQAIDDSPWARNTSRLNSDRLLALLKGAYAASAKAGKKRATAAGPSSRRAKKPRLESVESDDVVEVDNTELVPVYRHILDLRYTGAEPTALREWLDKNGVEDDERLELGPMSLAHPGDSAKIHHFPGASFLDGFSQPILDTLDGGVALLFPPLIPVAEDPAAYDLPPFANDFLSACLFMQSLRRVKVTSALTFIRQSPKEADPSVTTIELPFRLQLEIDVALCLPELTLHFKDVARNRLAKAEIAQRAVLTHIFPTPTPPPTSYRGETDIPFFYSVLGPAPALSSPLAMDICQPASLLPTLLPFQRRSTAWLLAREGKAVTPGGSIVPAAHDGADLALFWDKLDGTKLYRNRLTGVVQREAPPASTVFGGILAEEPGLGKTLESIALVLLNPDPARNPANRRWDPDAQVNVKEIKTTLIVTPASLAQQWLDELKLHAPSLRVLEYNGWSKVPVPITEAQVEAVRQKRRMAKGKGKQRATSPSRASSRKATMRRTVYADSDAGTSTASSDLSWAAARRARRQRNVLTVDSDVEMDDEVEEEEEEVEDWCAYVHGYDVCITTYNVLQQDLCVARPPPDRPRRKTAEYNEAARSRSPLVMCEWARVIMDEVQMVGGGKTEEMVSLIPRMSSFAVSGTPARAQAADLIHVLKFLRVEPTLYSATLWNRLQRPAFAGDFAALFQKYAIRTMKASVQEELTIPQQRRFLVPIELGKVERHVYDQTLDEALLAIGLDHRGVAASAGWEADTTVLRTWLRRLRAVTTHPQVGQLNGYGDRLHKPGVLKTIGEVLEGMRDLGWKNMMDDRKKKIEAIVKTAQLTQHQDDDPARYENSLELLLQAEKETNEAIEDMASTIAAHDLRGEEMKKEAATLRLAHEQRRKESAALTRAEQPEDNGKGKGRATDGDEDEDKDDAASEADSDESGGLPKTPAGEEHAAKGRGLQMRLREFQIVLHKVKFLQGDVYNLLGESKAAEEDAAYGVAEQVRRNLLKATEQTANRAMAQLKQDAAGKIGRTDLMIMVPFLGKGGIRSSDLMEEANDLIDDLLNEQSELLWEWRTQMHHLLTQKLAAEDEDKATGQEYTKTLETQGQAETLLQAYAALMADRREVLVAERTTLAAHETMEVKKRKTKRAMQADAEERELMLAQIASLEQQAEDEVLASTLKEERKELMLQFNGRALKSVAVDLSNIVAKISNDNDPEKLIARESAMSIRRLISAQNSLMDKLETDLVLFRKAFNDRILYFRQLQEISDSVSAVEWDGLLENALQDSTADLNMLEARVTSHRARLRYLDNLAGANDDEERDEDEDYCILCRDIFKRGYITQCAHVFCEDCMKIWAARREGKMCPVCRLPIDMAQMQRFTVNAPPENPTLPVINTSGEVAPRSLRKIDYNFVEPAVFGEIQRIESYGSYGSKIETLVRHLLHIQMTDPGAKSIVFSAWADSLLIIQHALVNNGISCLRIDQNSRKENAAKKFRTDPSILVLLLHGERENAGLNVTCASRVFLVESVVNHSFELQAIARVDRMGQQRQTEVYCYYAEDTVERNILDLAARQGLSLYTKDNSAGTVSVAPFADDRKAAESPVKRKAKQKGDFIFSTEDMLAILFPAMFEDVEFLIPSEASDEQIASSTSRPLHAIANALAGPSRLQ